MIKGSYQEKHFRRRALHCPLIARNWKWEIHDEKATCPHDMLQW